MASTPKTYKDFINRVTCPEARFEATTKQPDDHVITNPALLRWQEERENGPAQSTASGG